MTSSCPVPLKFLIMLASCLLSCSAVLSAGELPADEFGWTLRRDRDEVQVYTRKVEDSPYDAVKATTVINDVRLSSLVAIILDVQACPNWADKCAESRLLETLSATEMLIYTVNDMPFPVMNRDVVSHLVWQQDPVTHEIRLTSSAVDNILPEKKGLVRLHHALVDWTFTPQEDGSTRITNTAHIDPGSPLPDWLINSLLVDIPFKTLRGFRKQVLKEKYRDVVIDFVEEPKK